MRNRVISCILHTSLYGPRSNDAARSDRQPLSGCTPHWNRDQVLELSGSHASSAGLLVRSFRPANL